MKSVKSIFFLFVLLLNIPFIGAQQSNQSTAIAVVVDEVTYNKIKSSVDEYKNAVEQEGIHVYLLVKKWSDPSEIKNKLFELYKTEPSIEGAVLIGDIPIPMIRNAQHLTSAFKMDEEKYPYPRSSVPSDRYYDDFDLKFGYLGKDSVNKLMHYYSLLSDSPQRIRKDIYTSRIKPPVNDESKYKLIENYLIKVVKQKKEKNPVNNMVVFTGHGYHSESLDAWADERLSLIEQFPQVFTPGNRIRNLSHEMSNEMKEIVFNELRDPSLDIAVFHAHGNPDMQYLLDYPSDGGISGDISSIRLFLRSKMRGAKKPDETKEYFKTQYDIPDSWFEGTFTDSLTIADSLLGYSLDIYAADIDKVNPQAEFVIFDECFNGSFHKEDYIAGKYVFGNGSTIVGEGNSVNVLQDKWSDENLGLINKGTRAGLWHRFNNFLESHLIGDPTFSFTGEENNFNELIYSGNDAEFWKELLNDSDPVKRCLAIEMLSFSNDKLNSQDLVNIYKNDASVNVRMHALKHLAIIGDNNFQEILKLSVNDPYELIRRFSIVWMGEVGREEYLPYVLASITDDPSSRVTFNAKNSLLSFNNKTAEGYIEEYFSGKEGKYHSKIKNELLSSLSRNIKWIYDEILPAAKNDTLKLKDRIQEIKTFRNYHFHEAIPELLLIAQDNSQNEKVRSAILESLGWFNLYFNKKEIETVCTGIIDDTKSPVSVKQEALKTKTRLLTGLNNIFIP